MTTTARPLPRDPRPHRKVRASIRAGLVWAVAAAAIDCGVWLVGILFGVEFQVWTNGGSESGTLVTVGPIGIIGASLLAGLLAGVITGIAGRYIRRLARWIIVFGVLFTLASLTAPLEQPDSVHASTRILLLLMHVITGGLVIFGLVKSVTVDDKEVRF